MPCSESESAEGPILSFSGRILAGRLGTIRVTLVLVARAAGGREITPFQLWRRLSPASTL